MQIQNFYSDWLPAPSSALDNIVLSPHTIKTDGLRLTGMQDDYCDCHSRVCVYDPTNVDSFSPARADHNSTCHLKRCIRWLRNRHFNRREK